MARTKKSRSKGPKTPSTNTVHTAHQRRGATGSGFHASKKSKARSAKKSRSQGSKQDWRRDALRNPGNDRVALRAWFRKQHGLGWYKDTKLKKRFDDRLKQMRRGVTAGRAQRNPTVRDAIVPALQRFNRTAISTPNGWFSSDKGPALSPEVAATVFAKAAALARRSPGAAYLVHAPKQAALRGKQTHGSAWYWLDGVSLRAFEGARKAGVPRRYLPDMTPSEALRAARGNMRQYRTAPSPVIVIDAFRGSVQELP